MPHLTARPLWPLLTAALIGLPVLYVASFGPACWLVDRHIIPGTPVCIVYRPLLVYLWDGQSVAYDVLQTYVRFGCNDGHRTLCRLWSGAGLGAPPLDLSR